MVSQGRKSRKEVKEDKEVKEGKKEGKRVRNKEGRCIVILKNRWGSKWKDRKKDIFNG